MPTIATTSLRSVLVGIYVAAGLSEEEADAVGSHQIEADLYGHSSHGVVMTDWYVDTISRGDVVPGAPLEVIRESASTAVLDAHFGPGHVATARAIPIVVSKAAETGIGAVTIRRQGHVGRLGYYTARIAAEGLIGILTADSGNGPKLVAPLGGREARLGSNPISIAVPSTDHGPVVLDMATAAASGGKVLLARRDGQSLPAGWLMTREGKPSTDPNDFGEGGGALLPLGADQAHKGYGLSFMIEVLSGILTGIGFASSADGRHNDGVFMTAIDIGRFRDLGDFSRDVSAFIEHLKATPLATGHTEIRYPGELGQRKARHSQVHGLSLDRASWDSLDRLAEKLGVAGPSRHADSTSV
ncbi:MAG: Ldh family oxidoreductase [Actinophytocola sp.]|uniref:Ldh family oxidoreductase n=1 Tax=Actinophytocola sp. TaxID=1872138 RepID=UPI00132A6C3E|nr:Ldh family oxidoreductase [Actinophytocola sp.]MPZ80061.1 Ldh family oxidoreductase [Actinophytocola sp.]